MLGTDVQSERLCLAYNGQLYEIEADCEPHHFPDIGNMIRAKTLRVPLKPLCFIQRVISWAVNTH